LIQEEELNLDAVWIDEIKHRTNAAAMSDTRALDTLGVKPTRPGVHILVRLGDQAQMVKAGTSGFERLASITSVFEQVEANRSERDDRHSTRERGAVAVVRRTDKQRAQNIAVEGDAPVEVPHRQSEMMHTRLSRRTDTVSHRGILPHHGRLCTVREADM
jgi:hypothetical protein